MDDLQATLDWARDHITAMRLNQAESTMPKAYDHGIECMEKLVAAAEQVERASNHCQKCGGAKCCGAQTDERRAMKKIDTVNWIFFGILGLLFLFSVAAGIYEVLNR